MGTSQACLPGRKGGVYHSFGPPDAKPEEHGDMSTQTAARAAELRADRDVEVERIIGLRREFAEVVEASEANIADDEHDPEGSTIAYERTQISALIRQAE